MEISVEWVQQLMLFVFQDCSRVKGENTAGQSIIATESNPANDWLQSKNNT